jgi:hypothetical protein
MWVRGRALACVLIIDVAVCLDVCLCGFVRACLSVDVCLCVLCVFTRAYSGVTKELVLPCFDVCSSGW